MECSNNYHSQAKRLAHNYKSVILNIVKEQENKAKEETKMTKLNLRGFNTNTNYLNDGLNNVPAQQIYYDNDNVLLINRNNLTFAVISVEQATALGLELRGREEATSQAIIKMIADFKDNEDWQALTNNNLELILKNDPSTVDERKYNKVEFDENNKPIIKLVNRQQLIDSDKIVMDSLDLLDIQELTSLVDYNVKTNQLDNVYTVVDNYDFNHPINEKTYIAISNLLLINNANPTSKVYYHVIRIANQYGNRLTRFTDYIKK